MFEQEPEEIKALLQELRDKKIVSQEILEELFSQLERGEDVRVPILACIDARVAGNGITAIDAARFVDRLKLPQEYIDIMREGRIEKELKKRRLN